jgi:hypothetical protein
MIALIEPPMIAVMEPFLNGQKAVLGPALNYRFSPPFKVPSLVDFCVVQTSANILNFSFAMSLPFKNSVCHYCCLCYYFAACPEDRATLGSDPSAAAGGYTDGQGGDVLPFSVLPIGHPLKR